MQIADLDGFVGSRFLSRDKSYSGASMNLQSRLRPWRWYSKQENLTFRDKMSKLKLRHDARLEQHAFV
jgi:hypothetical protein